jgi:hypothetical protein
MKNICSLRTLPFFRRGSRFDAYPQSDEVNLPRMDRYERRKLLETLEIVVANIVVLGLIAVSASMLIDP